MSTPQSSTMPERDLHAVLIGDLDFAAQLLEDLGAAEQAGNRDLCRVTRGQVSIALDWMRDRLGHAAGGPCLFEPHVEYCPVEAEGVAG